MMDMNISEKVIRRLYEITHSYHLGFEAQIAQLLVMGLDRFNLDIGILAKIDGDKYTVEHCIVPENIPITPGLEFLLGNTLCEITCNADGPVALEHIGLHEKYASHPAYLSGGLESYIGIPIRLDGALYGTLNFSSPTPYKRNFQDIDIDALQVMASWIEVEMIRRRQEEKLIELNSILEKKAYEDSLTLIPNRRASYKHLTTDINRIAREQGSAVLAIIDVDNFKIINDTHGHQKGDEILKKIAETINAGKRDYDFLARFGGEEFLLWLPNSDKAAAITVCERIRKDVEGLSVLKKPVTISVGLTLYSPTSTYQADIEAKIDTILSQADKALYSAKDAGKNCLDWYQ
jgi:diguanylate cyclase (GGDEF)-like protein